MQVERSAERGGEGKLRKTKKMKDSLKILEKTNNSEVYKIKTETVTA